MSAPLDLSRPWLSEQPVAWPVLASVELKSEQAVSITAFELPLLVVRGKSGTISVHIDRCPHRHVSFSTGGGKRPRLKEKPLAARTTFNHLIKKADV